MTEPDAQLDVLIVGAGFAGMRMLHLLRAQSLSVRLVEAGSGFGGTWYWNRYPGARCDVPSWEYSYADREFEQTWSWKELYAPQTEILSYLEHAAAQWRLDSDTDFDTRITMATFDRQEVLWTLETDAGRTYRARFVVLATGCLSAPIKPTFAGLETYQGETYTTSAWPHEPVDFVGKTVAVIGTGSSGVQVIPEVARDARHLTVFQRTPNYSAPARNRPVSDEEMERIREDYPELRRRARSTAGGRNRPLPLPTESALSVTPEEREKEFWRRWEVGGTEILFSFTDIRTDPAANDELADFVRKRIAETVHEPETAAALTPKNYYIGTKRLPLNTDYFETFNRANVSLVNLHDEPIEGFSERGILTASGEHPVDVVVFATGFDALTGAIARINISDSTGRRLKDDWESGPQALLGLMAHGFPNLFMVTGPGSPSVLSNVVASVEQHVDWIADCIQYVRESGATAVEASAAAQSFWGEHRDEVASRTLYPQTPSWYTGANIVGKPRVFIPYAGGAHHYRAFCQRVADSGYCGFSISSGPDDVKPSDDDAFKHIILNPAPLTQTEVADVG